MKPLYNVLIRSNLFIALAATSLYFYYGLKYTEGFSLLVSLVVFTGVFFAYNLLRLSAWKLKKKYIGHENIRFYHHYRLALMALSFLLFIIMIFSLGELSRAQWTYCLIGFLSLIHI